VSKNTTSKSLLNLIDFDKNLVALINEREGLISSNEALSTQITELQGTLGECETLLELRKAQQEEETKRLKDEEARLSEQRKQLTALGSKSAKLVERQIDIASQTLQQMEERVTKLIDEVEDLEAQRASLKDTLDELESQLKDQAASSEDRLSEIETESAKIEKSRSAILKKLEERLLRLYNRVHRRYPDSAIAIAQKHSCRSCFRSLPSQMYNQVIAGNLTVQCPGCSRLLVYVPAIQDEKAA